MSMENITCLQCGKEAANEEMYEGAAIRVCEDGHRTGMDTGKEVLDKNTDECYAREEHENKTQLIYELKDVLCIVFGKRGKKNG